MPTLVGRLLTEVDPTEGIYVDEEGTVYQLAGNGETKPILIEETPGEGGELEQPRNMTSDNATRATLVT